eukprot:357826-Chlamydomonas_euryale.AAC.10
MNKIKEVYGVCDEARIKKAFKEARINEWCDFIDIDNCVLIIGEVHNLLRPLSHQQGDHT